jgi:hypothetical protein
VAAGTAPSHWRDRTAIGIVGRPIAVSAAHHPTTATQIALAARTDARLVRTGRVVTRVAVGVLIFELVRLAAAFVVWPTSVGVDYELHRTAAASWLSGSGFYLPHQLAGPYSIHFGMAYELLYPPVILWLLVPFLYLPAVLWWAIPIGLIAASMIRLRPASWTWPVFALLMLFPYSWQEFLWGNPSMWVLAFASLGAAFGWPGVLVLLKPTLAPFALLGINRRSWWVALGVFGVMCLPFGSMWLDWLQAAVVNPTNGGLTYSLPYVPAMCIPLLAWLGSTTTQQARVAQRSPATTPASS